MRIRTPSKTQGIRKVQASHLFVFHHFCIAGIASQYPSTPKVIKAKPKPPQKPSENFFPATPEATPITALSANQIMNPTKSRPSPRQIFLPVQPRFLIKAASLLACCIVSDIILSNGARGGTRTHKPLRVQHFKCCA